MSFDNIIFDLGGVVFTNGTKKFIQSLTARYPTLDIMLIKNLIHTGPLADAYRAGQVSRHQFWQTIIHKLNLKESIDQLENEWISYYKPKTQVIKLIQRLQKTGRHCYYLSDNIKQRAIRLDQKYNFQRLFKGGVFSYHIGLRKPNLKVYQALLNTYKLDPSACLFIDDKPKNLLPAKKLGMTPILFTSPQKLLEDFQNLQVI
ncbi:MAG: HAD family phosphatase [bacterium]|nr:HAD family phosphatase [bacterium]